MLNLVYVVGLPTKNQILVKALPSNRLKLYLAMVFLALATLAVNAQGAGAKSDFWSHVRFGGGLGLGFGSNSFNIAVTPSGVYQFNPQVAAGVGLLFNYSEVNQSSLTAIGGSVLTYFNPIPAIQLSAEFEHVHVNLKEEFLDTTFEDQYWVPALFLGAGFGNRNVMVGLRYDVLYDSGRSIYIDPWMPFVRVYF